MTGHDDRTAANADRHARASHRHRVRDGRRAGAACGCVRSGPSPRPPSLPRSGPQPNRSCANKAKRATWSTLDGSCGLPG